MPEDFIDHCSGWEMVPQNPTATVHQTREGCVGHKYAALKTSLNSSICSQ